MAAILGKDDEELVVAEEFSQLSVGDGYGGIPPGAVCYKAEFSPPWSETARARNYNSMCAELPETTKKYRVSAKHGATMRNGVSLKTELALQGALGPIKQGEIVHGDDEVWNDQGDLRVHIIVPNTSLGCGYVTGWVSFKTLTPLNDDGTPLPRPTFWTHELTVRLQENFEWGYRQASVQTLIRKIKQDVDDMRAESKKAAEGGGKGKKVPTFREYVDALWMKVRGPALAKCGMPATMKGLNEQQAMDHFAYGEDERTWGIMDAHNRIVQLMAAQDPSKVVPAKDMVGKRTMLTAKVNEQGDMVVEGGE